MNYKELAEDALDVAKHATNAGVAADHMARANVYATLALVEAQELNNLMHYAIDWTTGDDHYNAVGLIARERLGIPDIPVPGYRSVS